MSANPQYEANELALLLGKPIPYPESLTNLELMRFIFGPQDSQARPFITAFAGHPKSDAARWGGAPWWSDNECRFDELNAYTTLATFRAEREGDGELVSPEWRRREADMVACYGFMLDDLDEASWKKMLAPTWALETSRGNYQVVYLLREPCTHAATVNLFCRAMVDYAGGDPNAKNPPTRWVRLPQAVNGKYEPPWRCKMRVFNPDALYSLEDLAVKMNLQLDARVLDEPRRPVDTATLYGELAEVEALAAVALPAQQTRTEWVSVMAAIRGATLHKPEAGLSIAMKYSWANNEAQLQHTADTFWSFRANEVRSGIDQLRRHANVNPDPTRAFANLGRAESEPAPMFLLARDIPEQESGRYIVKGLLDEGAFALVYGGSMAGKTFLAIDMALHIAAGRPWMGCRVAAGVGVVLVANEGYAGAQARVRAAAHHHGIELAGLPLAINTQGINLGANRNLVQYRAELARAIEAVRAAGARHVAVIFDTFATTWVGTDENDSQGVGAVIAQMNTMKAHVTPMLIHHPGKDVARGPRGHSSLFAAADTVWRVQREERTGQRTLTAEKQRDGECGVPWGFELQRVNTGFDADGDAVSTCVVAALGRIERDVQAAAAAQAPRRLRGLALQCLQALGDAQDAADSKAVSRDAWWLQYLARRTRESPAVPPRRIYKTAHEGFLAMVPNMVEGGSVLTEKDLYWVADRGQL